MQPPLSSKGMGLLVLAYAVGAIPWAQVMCLLFGGDEVHEVGSGNVGAMNIFRNVNPVAGVLTMVLDATKGAAAVILAQKYGLLYGCVEWLPLAAAVSAVIGHNYTFILGFRGGKGLATTAGALVVLWPPGTAVLLASIGLGAFALGDANAGTGVGVWLLPPVFWLVHRDMSWLVLGAALALTIASRHLRDFRAYLSGRRRAT